MRCHGVRASRCRNGVRAIPSIIQGNEHTENPIHGCETAVTVIGGRGRVRCVRHFVTATKITGALTVISLEITTSI